LKRAVPEVDAGAALEELIALREIVLTEEVKKNGFGYASQDRMAATINVVSRALKLKRSPSVTEVFDARFLPSAPVMPAR
jgi:hypothetical protein